MYDPESPTGSPATALKGVNGDSEGSTSEDSKGVDKEEDDEAQPNHVASGKTTQKLTRRHLRDYHRTLGSPEQCDSAKEKPTHFKGVAADSAPTSVSEELVSSGSKSVRSGAASKKSVVVVSSRQNSSEQPEDRKAGTEATLPVGQTELEAMVDDDEDAGHSVDSSVQDESSMASAADSQTSSSDAGASGKGKQKQGRPRKAAVQPAKASRRRRSEEVPSFAGPATRRQSVRLRSGEKRRGTSPTQLFPAKRARQKKLPAAAKTQGGRGTRGKVSNGEDESTTESQETLDEEPSTNQGDSAQDQSDTSMDVCPVEPFTIAPLEEEDSPVSSQCDIGDCADNTAHIKQGEVKESREPGTGQQAFPASSAASAVHSSSSVGTDALEQTQELGVETPTESGNQRRGRHEKDASETCTVDCTESSTDPEYKAQQNFQPIAATQLEPASVTDFTVAPDDLPVSGTDGRKEAEPLSEDAMKEQENSTPLVAVMETSSVSEEIHSVLDQVLQPSDIKVTLQENTEKALTTDSEAAAVPSHRLLSPTLSPRAVQIAGHRDRRYYCSPEKQDGLNSPEKGSLTPRAMRRKTRWQDAEPNVVSEPVMVSVVDPSMSPVATLPESPLPDWVSSSKPEEALDAQATILLPPPPPRALSPQRKETLASLDSSRPEKVKSRWRRSSELETRDVGPVVAPSSPPSGARMSSIPEEAPLASSGKESPRKKDRSPPSVPSKEYRESSREPRGGGGGAGSREPPESSALSRGSRDADRTETSRDRGNNGSGTNGSISAKPLDYEEIEENLYLFERRKTKSKKEVRRMICDCSLTKDEKDRGIMGCEEDCLNRLLMIECGSRCPNGENCSNRRFQEKTYIKVEKFMTDKKGWGLRTLETLSSGTFVMEYVGEVLTPEEFRKRVKQYARDNNQHYYFMALRSDEIIDATQKGNVSRFINHSCDPNCETQKWTVNGELRIGFFTRRPLRAGEELTFDYQFQRYGKEAQRCHCESSNCRGYIGEDTKMTLKSGRSLPPKRSSSSSSSKRVEERKRDTVEDLAMEEEIEKLSGGLKNREHTLLLARLMVRGEDIDTRRRLLSIIRNTSETACLRLFLDYHGLSLLWSWMADIPDNELALKAEILTVLRQLPIPNKTMVKDSKVMSVVHRWASQLAEQGSSGRAGAVAGAAESGTPPSEKQPKVASEEADSDGSESSGSQTPASVPGQRSLTGSVVCSPDSTNLVENGDSTPSDGPKDESSGKMAKELSDLTSTLLDSWSTLKEVFRIPRLEQQKRREDEREADRRERERNRQQKSRESSFSSRDSGSRRRSPPSSSSRDRRDRDYERSSDRRRYSASPERRDDRKPYHRSSDHRRSGSGSDSKPRKTLLPTPPRLTKEERRQLFALEVQQRDQEEALRRQFMVPPAPVQQSIVVPAPPPQGFLGAPGMVPVQGGCPTAPMGAPMVPGQPVPPLQQQQQQAMYMYDPATAAAMYGNPTHQPAVGYYDPQTGAPLPAPQPPAPPEYVLPHSAMLGVPQPVVAPGMQPPTDLGHHMVMHAPGPMVPPQQAVMAPPAEEPHPQHHALPPNIDYQALAAAISNVTNKPPSPVVMQPEATYLTDPMQIPLPPPLSPDSGDVTPQNPDPLSSPTLDSTEEAVELPPPVQQPEVGEPVGTSLEIVPPTSYEAAVATPPVLPSPTQTPAPAAAAAAAPSPAYPPVQAPVPYTVVAPGAGAPAGAPAMAAGAVYPHNPQAVATGYGPGYGPVGPTPAPGPVQSMHPQLYFLPPVSQATSGEQPPQSVVQMQGMEAPAGCVSSPLLQTRAPTKKSGRLPPHWKTAKDEEGNIYYYHAQTRETQWDPPVWDENEQDMDLETPTYDEPKVNSTVGSRRSKRSASKKKAVTVAADTSEVAKKIKELFRSKISSHIVHCLNPFRKPDCKLGRIQSTEDFKHLARKLTHFVMAKELKHCKNVEDLECNENVKHKAKEFIQKYMAKYGPVYRKDKAVSPKDE